MERDRFLIRPVAQACGIGGGDAGVGRRQQALPVIVATVDKDAQPRQHVTHGGIVPALQSSHRVRDIKALLPQGSPDQGVDGRSGWQDQHVGLAVRRVLRSLIQDSARRARDVGRLGAIEQFLGDDQGPIAGDLLSCKRGGGIGRG